MPVPTPQAAPTLAWCDQTPAIAATPYQAAAAAISLAPSVVDDAFGAGSAYDIPSFSFLGLALEGCGQVSSAQYATNAATSRSFMGVDPATVTEWNVYGDFVDDGAKVSLDTNGETVYEYLQKYIIQVSRYGMRCLRVDCVFIRNNRLMILRDCRSRPCPRVDLTS